jgi:alanine-alpha-ketoisovalerate/valine-pyruvate aminotransferase
MTTIRFENDDQRRNFQMKMALMTLQNEVQNTMGIRFYRGSIVNVLRRYFKDLPRTRKSAYKYLKARGYYDN